MMYKILINNLELKGFHGVRPDEKQEGQPFVFNLAITMKAKDGADDIDSTIDYSQVIRLIKEVNNSYKFDLLETLSRKVAGRILEEFDRGLKVKVSVKKTEPPIDEKLESVGVEYVERRQEGFANAYLSLGSNEGDSLDFLGQAVKLIGLHEGVEIHKVSSVYSTQPMYEQDQRDFLNQVVEIGISPAVDPFEFLGFLKKIEFQLGRRKKDSRYGPRPIDIDIVYWQGVCIESPFLTIPHPRFGERKFVLIPLMEIKPDFKIDGNTLKDYLKEKNFKEEVIKIEQADQG